MTTPQIAPHRTGYLHLLERIDAGARTTAELCEDRPTQTRINYQKRLQWLRDNGFVQAEIGRRNKHYYTLTAKGRDELAAHGIGKAS